MGEGRLDRRDFLRLAAGGAVCAAAAGAGCSSGSDGPKESAATGGPGAGSAAARELRIATWSHFVPAFDTWFDNESGKRWGEQHDVDAVGDHLPARVLAIRGHSGAA